MNTQAHKRVRAKPEARREQILEEATRLIGERGYYGFTIRELAQRCQLTDAGLLHYFGSKEKLLIALVEDLDRQGAETVREMTGLSSATRGPLTREQLHDMFRAIVSRNRARPDLVRLQTMLRTEAMNADHPAHGFFVQRQATILRMFAEGLGDHVPDPQSTALQVIAMMRGLEMEWMRSGRHFDLLEEWDRAFALLLPPPAA